MSLVRLGNDDDVLDVDDETELNECVWNMFQIQNTKPLAISKAMMSISSGSVPVIPPTYLEQI